MKQAFSRRDVLRFSAAAAAGLLLPEWRSFAWGQEGTEPAGAGELIVRTPSPLNAEPALARLVQSRITPIEQFYIRNHGPTPKIDAKDFHLRIEGMVKKPLELTLDEVKAKFKKHSAEATLTCAGNRRKEMSEIKPTPGVQWDAGAIGHASWGGATLKDILAAAEIQPGAKHVWFEGLDPIQEKDGSEAPFGGSIPLERAMASFNGTPAALVAYEMNDKPLTAEHGAPLRTLVPGFIGARSVKWLAKIVVSDKPSPNHFVAEAYKIVKTESKEELAAAEPIYTFPINAAICLRAGAGNPRADSTKLKVAGYALPSGDPEATIAKVELSTDGGKNWTAASLIGDAKPFCWQLWQDEIPATAATKLIVRATDSRGNVQPESTPWNLKGYLYNAWHRA